MCTYVQISFWAAHEKGNGGEIVEWVAVEGALDVCM